MSSQNLCMLLEVPKKFQQIRIRLEPLGKLNAYSERTGISKAEVANRTLEWFFTQTSTVQSLIIGHHPHADEFTVEVKAEKRS